MEGAPDPPPDAEEFLRDVVCEHDGLATNGAARKRVSADACAILLELFPNWRPLSSSMEQCAVCEALLHISKEDKREYRKQAEEEKVGSSIVLGHARTDFRGSVYSCRRG